MVFFRVEELYLVGKGDVISGACFAHYGPVWVETIHIHLMKSFRVNGVEFCVRIVAFTLLEDWVLKGVRWWTWA